MTDENGATIALYRGDAEKVHPLARWGESRVVRAMADRIMATDRRKVPLNLAEAILTAQAALAYGLDPFAGELWSWVSEVKDGRRVLTVMKGRDGILKIANKNARAQNTYLLPPRYRQVVDKAERERLQVPEGALAFVCIQEDYRSTQLWQTQFNSLKDAGVPAEQILETLGPPPHDWGLGILTAEEMKELDRRGGNKMTHVERCQKRAHMAALRQRFAAQEFDEVAAASLDTDDYIIESEWIDLPPAGGPAPTPDDVRKANAALYGEEESQAAPKLRPFEPTTVRNKVRAGVEKKYENLRGKNASDKALHKMRWQMRALFDEGDANAEAKVHSIYGFLFEDWPEAGRQVSSSKDLDAAEVLAVLDWLDSREDEKGDLKPNPLSVQEAGRIVTSRIEQLGQMSLELSSESAEG